MQIVISRSTRSEARVHEGSMAQLVLVSKTSCLAIAIVSHRNRHIFLMRTMFEGRTIEP
jgi:hypothetical protein